MTSDPQRRVALVTGASRGIGRAVAIALADAGYSVAVTARDAARAADTLAEIESRGQHGAAVAMDVTDEDSIARGLAEANEHVGPPTVLVNNAGISSAHPFGKITHVEWERAFAVNATGPFLVTKACLPGMRDHRFGRVISIASTAAVQGYAYTAHYTASKHALLGMTRALALEVGKKGITVNCVCPGFVDTEMTQESVANIVATTGRSEDVALEALMAQNPQGRLIMPDEVAAAVVYLASDGARSVNGQAIVI